MVHDRLSPYLEDKQKVPNTMYEYRPRLPTEDILLQIKECVIDNLMATQQSAILALDVKCALNNASHEAVFNNLQRTNCGQRICNYVRDFALTEQQP